MNERSVSFNSKISPRERLENLEKYFQSLPPSSIEKTLEPSPSLGAVLDARRKSGSKQYSHR